MSVRGTLAYHAICTEGNYPGQRQRFLRGLSASDWHDLYGPGYIYTCDYIHSHPQAYAGATRILARVANLFEECGEVMQRTTTWHMRFAGSIVPATLRDLCGKGRFCTRLRTALNAQFALPHREYLLHGQILDNLYEQLRHEKVINRKSQLVCDLQRFTAQQALERCLRRVLPDLSDDACARLVKGLETALPIADMRHHWPALSLRKKMAYVGGCAWSVGTQLGINCLLLLASSSLLATVVGKTLAISSMLYAASFLLRLMVTLHARVFYTYRGQRTAGNAAYRSLSEHGLQHTRRLRNRLYAGLSIRVPDSGIGLVDLEGLRVDRREFGSASFTSHGRGGLASTGEQLYARIAVDGTQRLTDVLYAADSTLSRLLGRGFRCAFASYAGFRQVAGHTANGHAQHDWQTPAYRNVRAGRLRLSLARLFGICGAETLGASIACFVVSGTWTAISKLTGGLGTVFIIGGAPAVVPLSSAVVGFGGWAVSLMADLVRRLKRDRLRKNSSVTGNRNLLKCHSSVAGKALSA